MKSIYIVTSASKSVLIHAEQGEVDYINDKGKGWGELVTETKSTYSQPYHCPHTGKTCEMIKGSDDLYYAIYPNGTARVITIH